MLRRFRFLCLCVLIISVCVACNLHRSGHRITVDQYDEVTYGMTYEEVVDAFGSAGEKSSEQGNKGTEDFVVRYRWEVDDGTIASLKFEGAELTLFSKYR